MEALMKAKREDIQNLKAKREGIQNSYILIAEKDGIELARAKAPSMDQSDFIYFLVTHRLDVFDEKIKCRAEQSYAHRP
jgi:hypothetical protein